MVVAAAVVASGSPVATSSLRIRCAKICCLDFHKGHAASSVLAIRWPMARSQAIETPHMFSLFIPLHWFEFLATPNGVLSIFGWAFWVLWLCRIVSIGGKSTCFCFLRFWNFESVWANKSSWIKAVHSNQSLKTIKSAARSRWPCRLCSHCSLSWRESILVPELKTPSNSGSGWNTSRVKTLTVFVTTYENRTMLLKSSCLTGGCVCVSSWVEIQLWISVCQNFCRKCPRLDNMPVS